MKKYSDEHLERVPAEFILALEKVCGELETGIHCGAVCPTKFTAGWICFGKIGYCHRYLKYKAHPSDCPCWHFGREEAFDQAQNLITQWKQWAGISK